MKVLLIVLAVLALLLLLPFGAVVRYSQEGFLVWVKVLFLRFQIFPKKEKKEKPKKEEALPKGQSASEEAPSKEPKKKGGTWTLVRSALPLLKPALAGVKKRLSIDELELFVTWAAQNPADAATGYGYANAALGTLWALLDENFKVKKSRLGCQVDFDAQAPNVYLNAALSVNLWKVLTLVLPLLVRFLRNYTRLKRAGDEKTKKEA